ncbi:Retinol dehydrogenase 13, partial [Stegodyphus mimosarum]
MLFPSFKSYYFSWDFVTSLCVFLRSLICPKRYVNKTALHGKTVIITGGSSGIGRETALDMVKRGARVIFTYTTEVNATDTLTYIFTNVPTANVSAKYLNLASFSSIYKFANEILENEKKIHILINNAGLATTKKETEEGFELCFGVNYLGHFLLTNLLLDRLKESAPARIINVSSVLHC